MHFKLSLSFVLFSFLALAQPTNQRVLFLGNSYTSMNNLPQMLKDAAASVSDTVEFDVNAPGGYTFQGHFTNSTSLNKIMAGGWDFVVLQEQSQMPSFPDQQVVAQVFPFAQKLDSIVRYYNSCVETVFYMTWGRKNGDASNCSNWPPVCSYHGMDSLLNLRYQLMAEQNSAIVSPVGAVWNYIRTNNPEIELYQTDESHPSVAGTYLAACTFYTTLFRKDPTLLTFYSSLSVADAINIQQAVKLNVFDSLAKWNIGLYDLNADFEMEQTLESTVYFVNNSTASAISFWSFGDGTTSLETSPTHVYSQPGNYEVLLISSLCGKTDTIIKSITVNVLNISEQTEDFWNVFPNPVNQFMQIQVSNQQVIDYVIYDVVGEIVHRGVLHEGKNEISTESLIQGVYHLEIRDALGALGRKKLIKLHP